MLEGMVLVGAIAESLSMWIGSSLEESKVDLVAKSFRETVSIIWTWCWSGDGLNSLLEENKLGSFRLGVRILDKSNQQAYYLLEMGKGLLGRFFLSVSQVDIGDVGHELNNFILSHIGMGVMLTKSR